MCLAKSFWEYIYLNLWIVQIIAIFAGVLFLHVILKFFFSFLKKKARFSWKEDIDYILLKPLHWLIWVLGLAYAIVILVRGLGIEKDWEYIFLIRNVFIVVIFTWVVLRWKKAFELFLIKKEIRKKIDIATLDFINKLLSIFIGFISLIIILQMLGVDIVPLIAFGGVGAAAIGFAAKDVIANFFGGMMLYFTRPFRKEDFIEIPKENIKGIVEHIGWYLTSIKNLDHSPTYVPNSMFSTLQIINLSRSSHRRFECNIGIRYQDFEKIKEITEELKKTILMDSAVDKHQQVLVNFEEFKESTLAIFIRAYIHYCEFSKFVETKQRLLLNIKNIIQAKGADIPFPTSIVEIQKPLS